MVVARVALLIAALAGARPAGAEPCAPPGGPRVSEILYDAAGDDTGREFVEILNPGPAPVPLAGLRLEAGDGSGPGRWTLRWTGAPGDTIGPGARFVIGGALVEPAAQSVASLDLQNGPDALRLVWPDGRVEVVGYGALEFPEYACGSPAADAPSGLALARVPDDADLGSNALDFRVASPTPGRANQSQRDLAVAAGSLALEPVQPAAGEPARLLARVENRGRETVPASQAVLSAEDAESRQAIAAVPLPALGPGDTLQAALALPGMPAGKRRLRVAVALDGDEAGDNDADSVWIRIGPGPLVLTEVQFHPAQGEGEWIEVVNRGDGPLDAAEFRLGDRGGAAARPEAGHPPLPRDSLGVLAQSRSALLARFPGLDSSRVWQAAPWPSLNNSDDAAGIADVVWIAEPDGAPSDRLAYSARDVPAGVPIERQGEVWTIGRPPSGSPLEAAATLAPLPSRFEISPRSFRAGAGGLRLRWDLPWTRSRVAFELWDLAGRPRGLAIPERLAPGRGEQLWTPRDLAPGIYLLALRARDDQGPGSVILTRALRVEGP